MKYTVSLFLAAFLAATTMTAQQARLQVIHNAADPAASQVDIYLNGSILLDDFAFRAATPFVDVPAGVALSIGVAPANSTGPQDIIATFTPTLDNGKTYVAVANGVLDPTVFAANPDMKNIAFTLFTADDARESGMNAGEVDLKVLHGASDAPAVDVIARGVGTLVDDAAYGDMTPYFSVPAASYTLDITPGNDNNTIVASFAADLSALGGGAAVVFASGFLAPANNMNGQAFGLFAALPDGNVVALPSAPAPQARLQVIHNAADPAAAQVDIYLNGSLLLDDFAFRAATPFVDVPAEVQLSIGVAPSSSTGPQDIIATFTPTLDDGGSYVAVANGVLDPTMFAANPDMKNIAFTLFTADDARESGMNPGEVDLKVLHGATDAPAVDVIARGVGTLVDDAAYGDMTPYFSVPAASYTLDITPGNDNNTIVASFAADLSALGGGAAVVFASGFLAPSGNMNGQAFGLFAALPDGNVVALPSAAAPQARLQVIHNAADPAAAQVDIYLNGSLLLDDFAFRAATPFVDVPATVQLSIGVAPSSSTGPQDIIATFTPTLDDGGSYIAIANGVLDPNGFNPNPDMKSIAFTLFTADDARESGMNAGEVDLKVVHGATDAPTVDVIARGVGTLVDDAAYGDMTPYFSVPAASYTLDITPGNDNNTVVASFAADLSALGGGAGVVLASGFLAPGHNKQGPAFGLIAVLPDGSVIELAQASAPTARVQVIHNAADPGAEVVDIYINNKLAINDFAFRAATPFMDLPAGTPLAIGVAPSTSTSAGDIIATFNTQLMADETYIVVANGVLDPTMFAANPDMNDIGFTLFTADMGREKAMNAGEVDLRVLHGATDAPAVDVIARGVGTLVDDAAYGDMTDYFSVPAGSYILDVTPGNDNSTVVASFAADLSALGGGAAVVFASGFLSPVDNMNGAAFGIFAALPDGSVVTLPAPRTPQARLQVIHNAADPAAEQVDIYLNGSLLLDDFAFRAATPFVDVPAEVELTIGVAPANSTGAQDIIATFTPTLSDGMSYIAVANGVLDPTMFAANPGMKDIAFTLFTADDARESGMNAGEVDLKVLHGATDAPAVDVIARGVGTLVDDAAYGDMTPYFSVPAASYTLDITPGMDNSTIVASYTADLSGLGGGAAVVFASGFLAPAGNMNGEAFGLYAALPDGTVIALPMADAPTARLQVVHNAADPGANQVDIYLNGTLLLDDFTFRTATPFVDVPAGVDLTVGVAPGSSMSADDVIAEFTVNLEDRMTYVAIASGVLDPMQFAANPDGRATGFRLYIKEDARSSAIDDGVDLVVFHGATDAPTVDVIARDVATIVDDAAYGDFTSYFNVPAGSYTLDVTPGGDNSTVVASFRAELNALDGGSAVVFASGFLAPAQNGDGAPFGLFAALGDGTVVPLSGVTSVRDDSAPLPVQALSAYPNPAREQATLRFAVERDAAVTLRMFDISGREVFTADRGQLAPGIYDANINTANLAPGLYRVLLSTSAGITSTTVSVVR